MASTVRVLGWRSVSSMDAPHIVCTVAVDSCRPSAHSRKPPRASIHRSPNLLSACASPRHRESLDVKYVEVHGTTNGVPTC